MDTAPLQSRRSRCARPPALSVVILSSGSNVALHQKFGDEEAMLCRFTVFWRKPTFSLSMQLEGSMQIPFHKTCSGHRISRRALNSHHTDFCQQAGAPLCHPSRVSWEAALLLVGWRHVHSRRGCEHFLFIARFFAPLKAQSLFVEGLDSINHLRLSTTTCQMWEYCLR